MGLSWSVACDSCLTVTGKVSGAKTAKTNMRVTRDWDSRRFSHHWTRRRFLQNYTPLHSALRSHRPFGLQQLSFVFFLPQQLTFLDRFFIFSSSESLAMGSLVKHPLVCQSYFSVMQMCCYVLSVTVYLPPKACSLSHRLQHPSLLWFSQAPSSFIGIVFYYPRIWIRVRCPYAFQLVSFWSKFRFQSFKLLSVLLLLQKQLFIPIRRITGRLWWSSSWLITNVLLYWAWTSWTARTVATSLALFLRVMNPEPLHCSWFRLWFRQIQFP